MEMVTAEKVGDKIHITAHGRDRDRCGLVPSAKWKADLGVHVANLSWATCKALRGIMGERLEIGKALYDWACEEFESRVGPCTELRQATEVSDSSGLCDGLYPFQQAGAMFLVTAQQAILADLMGSGKTIQAIAAAKKINATRALIVCPNSMKSTWKKEIEKWWPGMQATVVDGTKAKRSKAIQNDGFTIINWESVRLHSRLAPYGSIPLSAEDRTPKELNLIDWDLIIIDEGHRMQDPKSKQTRAVWSIAHNVPYRWILTGTPVTNTPETMFSLLHCLNPVEWPSKGSFIDRYCDTVPRYWGPGVDIVGLNEATKEEFFEIFDPRFRRMPKEVVLPNLPPVQNIRRDIAMGEQQATAYRQMAEEMVAETENGELLIAVNPITKLTRLVQFASSSVELDESGRAWLCDPSNKLDQLMEDLNDLLPAGESVAVFAVSRQLIDMASGRLSKKGIHHRVIKGGQSSEERQKSIDDFQNGTVPVILIVQAAGGTGITLTKARIGIWLQRPWSNVEYQQSLARIHRIGSEIHESVIVIDYITTGTVEVRQLRVLEGKGERLEDIVRDRDAIRRMLYGDELD